LAFSEIQTERDTHIDRDIEVYERERERERERGIDMLLRRNKQLRRNDRVDG
jgi:hypothetical protein